MESSARAWLSRIAVCVTATLVVLQAGASPLAPPARLATLDERVLEPGTPVVARQDQISGAGTDSWRVTATVSGWLGVLVVADVSTTIEVDAGSSALVEGCVEAGCRWAMWQATAGQQIRIDVSWTADAEGEYLLAALAGVAPRATAGWFNVGLPGPDRPSSRPASWPPSSATTALWPGSG